MFSLRLVGYCYAWQVRVLLDVSPTYFNPFNDCQRCRQCGRLNARSLAIFSNNFTALTTVSFPAGWQVVAASVAGRSARGSFARDGLRFGAGVLKSCSWTRLQFDEDGCDPGYLYFPNFLNEENFGDMNLRMMIQSQVRTWQEQEEGSTRDTTF